MKEKIIKLPIIWELRKLILYLFYTHHAYKKFNNISIVKNSIKDFKLWWKNKPKNFNPLLLDQPWFNFNARRYLDKIIFKDMIVFEFGSGSSTMYFANRVNRLYSIEHDEEWYNQLKKAIEEKNLVNINLSLNKPQPKKNGETVKYKSNNEKYINYDFENYVKKIDIFPNSYFDLIVIDGRSRNECLKHSISKLKKGGYIIFDNSERDQYLPELKKLSNNPNWEVIRFVGPVPYIFEFSETSFYKKIK